jgi:hypothetical protein
MNSKTSIQPSEETLAKIIEASQNSPFLADKKAHAMRFAKKIVEQIEAEKAQRQA